MNDLIVATIKIAFLVLMWLFIAGVAHVIRTDLFGRRIPATPTTSTSPTPKRRGSKRHKEPTRFVVTQGTQVGLEVPVATVINLGRSADSTINIDDDYASTRHAQLVQIDPYSWSVSDLDSTNGTFVNGVRVTSPVAIKVGDVVRIGRTQFMLER